uniref:Glycosyltransferase 2-like domain-containing protein n=1 Tax=viral metagenome TaxID=1070528 RepID=A0A6C0IJ11_9ZZZZ
MISILIPIYNGIEFIDESVMSVINQTYSEWELLIGVNGHPEKSNVFLKAKQYEDKSHKVRVLDFFNIKGKSNTLNEMIKYCSYDYVAILDVDDIWEPEKLEIQSKFLHIYDVIGTRCVYFGEKNLVPYIPTGDISNFDFTRVNPIINSSSVIRKELCFWNNKWDSVEDYDLWLRLRKMNKKFYNCDKILVKHRIHNTSAFNSKGNDLLAQDLVKSYK